MSAHILPPARLFLPRSYSNFRPLPVAQPVAQGGARAALRLFPSGKPAPARARHSSAFFCTLYHQRETHPLPFQSFPRSLQKHPGWHSSRLPISPVIYPQPRRVTLHSFTVSIEGPLSSHNSFKMNTCKSVSKQRTLTSFGINTYAKMGGREPVA